MSFLQIVNGRIRDSNPTIEVHLTQIAYPAFCLYPNGITSRGSTLPLRAAKKMGWTMGLEPTTTGITSRGSTN